jgi:hypothetical protein
MDFRHLGPVREKLAVPGTPARRASIMTEFPKIAANTPLLSLVEMTGQSSYPLNFENASPPGTCTVYLSAEMATPPKTASPAPTTVIIAVGEILVIAHSLASVCKSS